MTVLNALRIGASALTAQRLRMDVIANNVANVETTRSSGGGPYKAERVVFSSIEGSSGGTLGSSPGAAQAQAPGGLQVAAIVEDDSPGRMVYNPKHPDANAEGYVAYPNVDLVTEMVDMLAATRAYETNVTALNAVKTMAARALEIGKS
jgi:flagellar basal-body rod protein FlgC